MKKNEPGFTLIELMAVIVILGILATVVAVNVSPFLQRANHLKEDVITQINNVDHEFESLCSYFAAPPPPATSPDTFFELVNSFVKTFSSTVKQVDEKIVSFFHFQFLSTVSIF